MQLLTLTLKTFPLANKSLFLAISSIFLPLTLNIETPSNSSSVEAGTLTNNLLSSIEEESTLTVNNEASLATNLNVVDEQSVITPPDSQLLETKSKSNNLISLLEEKGIKVIEYYKIRESDRIFDPIACYLEKRYSVLKKLHRKIKASIAKKTSFSFNLHGKTQHEIQSCTQYCTELHRATLLSRYYYDKRRKIIHGTVQHRGDVIQFLNGGWFERAILSRVKEKLAKCQKVEFLVNPLLKFANNDRFELDLLFLADNQLFWIECKTGNHYNDCLPKYCQHREKLGVAKENAFLVGLELSDQDANNWNKLWAITVVNTDGLLKKHQFISDFSENNCSH